MESKWKDVDRLASREPVTPDTVAEFARKVRKIWKSDPEQAHMYEYVLRTRVLEHIATMTKRRDEDKSITRMDKSITRMDKSIASMCEALVKLSKAPRLPRWFA